MLPFKRQSTIELLNAIQVLLCCALLACGVLANGDAVSEMGFGVFQALSPFAAYVVCKAGQAGEDDTWARIWALVFQTVALCFSLAYTGWSAYVWAARCQSFAACRDGGSDFVTANVVAYLMAGVQLMLVAVLALNALPQAWRQWVSQKTPVVHVEGDSGVAVEPFVVHPQTLSISNLAQRTQTKTTKKNGHRR